VKPSARTVLMISRSRLLKRRIGIRNGGMILVGRTKDIEIGY
jgi:hypothetical protein